MIDRLKTGSSQAVAVMQRSKERGQLTVEQSTKVREILSKISESVTHIYDKNKLVAQSSQKQMSMRNQMDTSVNTIVEISQKTSEGMQQTENISNQVSQLTQSLADSVARFKI